MEFKFKRKYTSLFIVALLFHIALATIWITPLEVLFPSTEIKHTICFLILVNIELIIVLYVSLFRKKYYTYHDRIQVKRVFLQDLSISYKDIAKIVEHGNDTVLLAFGKRPSFTLYFHNGKRRKYTIRSDNNELMLKIIKNEINIANSNNNGKKLTK